MRYLLYFLILASSFVQAITPASQLFHYAEQHQSVINEQLTPNRRDFSHLSIMEKEPLEASSNENCLPISTLKLTVIGEHKLPYFFSNNVIKTLATEKIKGQAEQETRYAIFEADNVLISPCLSTRRIERITTKLQNNLIGTGFVTTRVLIPEQNLSSGELTLAISVGSIGEFKVDETNVKQTHANRATLFNAFPMREGERLNLRDIEQGLDNLRRLPTVAAEMDIQAGQVANSSDIIVNWKQRTVPIRFNASIDNSGSKATGKYLGNISLAWDNPLHINDILIVSYTHSLKPGVHLSNSAGGHDKSKTHNSAFSYSAPFGYWQFNLGMSDYFYDQIVAGVNRNYHYTGDSTRGQVDISRVLYRDDQHKIFANAGLWAKSTKSYIDGLEIEVQRRRTAGWNAGISQQSYFSSGTLTSNISYKRGTRAFGAIAAPEELFNEGTGKMKIWTTDINWQMPLNIGGEQFQWDSKFHGQWNKTSLTAQDKLAIGGLYSVRGFNGERSLSAERGWYFRNDLSWHYTNNHQLYLGIDTGHVSGNSAQYLPGKSLTGAVLGMKGQLKRHGQWYYNIFIGKPLAQPQDFSADSSVFGFNFSYSL